MFFLLFITNLGIGQTASDQEYSIVRLHNGSVFVGVIVNDEGPEIAMHLASGNEISFSKSDVKHYIDSKGIIVYNNGKFHVIKGSFFQTGLGFNLANFFGESDKRISTHLPFIYGYHLNSQFALGAGLGFEFNFFPGPGPRKK